MSTRFFVGRCAFVWCATVFCACRHTKCHVVLISVRPYAGRCHVLEVRQYHAQYMWNGGSITLNKYKDALAAGIKVNPLIISTAGTMHKAMHKSFKKFIPNAYQRSCVLMDIAIFLAKGRGQIYSRNIGVIEMVAAAEEAVVIM